MYNYEVNYYTFHDQFEVIPLGEHAERVPVLLLLFLTEIIQQFL